MTKILLKIYDFFSAHRAVAYTVLAVSVGICAFMISRVEYSEDISAFLPQNEESRKYSSVYERLGGSKIAVLFRFAGQDSHSAELPEERQERIIEAMDRFGELWEEADTARMVQDMQVSVDDDAILEVAGFIRSNAPYLMTADDYRRIDSLLAVPGYIPARMKTDRQMLMFPASAIMADNLRNDPLDFFTPLYKRLLSLNAASSGEMIDSHIFIASGEVGAVFFTSPFGNSESGMNSELAEMLEKVIRDTEACFGDVQISATGGPLIAVANARQIKRDSILAIVIALVLISLVLFLSFREFSDIIWIGTSILCGSIFSLGLIAAFKSSVSVIVLGISSVIIGIAVNYPLHYIDHLKHEPDTKKALKDIVNPLLVGNITTVCAFLSLFLLRAEALHDFGLMGALMLAGTILFVLIFLPALMKSGRKRSPKTISFDFTPHIPDNIQKKLLLPFVILTVVLAFFSFRTSFDSDMRNINYMTPSQREDLALLSASSAGNDSTAVIYAVCEGEDDDALLEENERLAALMSEVFHGSGVSVGSLSGFVPSQAKQRENLALWRTFTETHPSLAEELSREAQEAGFSASAFRTFEEMLGRDYEVVPPEHFSPLSAALGQAFVLRGDDGTACMVNYVSVPSGGSELAKESIRKVLTDNAFVFDAKDVGNRLVALLSDDFDSIGFVCSLIVFLFLWISFRRIELSLLSFLPLAISWIWILGIMQIFGLKFNIVNIILATFIFGQGDDYTIFITEGLMYEYACGKKILSSYKNSVALSAVIMFIGIGALVVAQHPAMRSLAHVTIVGMLTVVMAAWFLPPAVFGWMTSRGGRRRAVPVTLGSLCRTAFSLAAFMLAMAVVIPCSWLYFLFGKSEAKTLKYHRFLCWISGFVMRHIPGVSFRLENKGKEDFSRPAVIISNHQSHLDILCLLMLHPKITVLTNSWVWKFYRGVIGHAEFLPVSDGMESNIGKLRETVRRGYSVLVFPEGTRSADCTIGRFHRGAFYIAEELGLDIVPVVLHGAGHVLPKGELMLRKGSIYVEVQSRISPDDKSFGEDYRERTRAFRRYYTDSYERLCTERETAAYYAGFVRHQYFYKGAEIEKAAGAQLSAKHLELIDSFSVAGGRVRIVGSGTGAFAMLFAMTRKNVEVWAFEADAELYAVAANCHAAPHNLHYIHGGPEDGCDIDLRLI